MSTCLIIWKNAEASKESNSPPALSIQWRGGEINTGLSTIALIAETLKTEVKELFDFSE